MSFFLDNAITFDFAVKLATAAILYLAYQEGKNKIFLLWFFAWLFFALTAFFDHLLLSFQPNTIWLIRNGSMLVMSTLFITSLFYIANKNRLQPYGILLGLAAFASVYYLLFHDNNWIVATGLTHVISGLSLVLCGVMYQRIAVNKYALHNIIISSGFILNGLHSADFPLLRPVTWFAPYGYLICGLLAAYFAVGMVLKSNSEIKRQRQVNLEHIRELATLYTITSTICRSRKLDQIVHAVLDNIMRILKVDNGAIFIFDKDKKTMYLRSHRGMPKELAHKLASLPVKGTVTERVIKENKMIIVPDFSKTTSTVKDMVEEAGISSIAFVPLRSGSSILGTITLGMKEQRKFKPNDIRLLESVSNELGVAIDNKQLAENLERLYLSTVLTLTDIVEAKDHYTRSHSDEVTRYAVMTAREMNLSDKEVEKIRLASQLHDLGKIAISDLILLKQGKLNEEEWEQVKKHPEKAVQILKPLTFLHENNGILEYIKGHHERYDGKGYPNGFKEDQIKLGGRILSVADAYHAMVSARPYRPRPLTKEEARDELKKNAGLQFDPEVVEAFLKALEKKEQDKNHY